MQRIVPGAIPVVEAIQAVSTTRRIWEFIEHPFTLTVVAIIAGVIGVVVFTPVLILCGVLLFAAIVRTNLVTAAGRKRWLVYGCISLLLAATIYGANALVRLKINPPPPPPQLSIIAYEVILFKPKFPPFANIFVENSGGDGRIIVYGDGAVSQLSADENGIIKEVKGILQKTVKEGGGLVFTIKAHEKRWFSVSGPALTEDQAHSLGNGERMFFFLGTIVVNGGGPQDYSFCSFVVGDKPNVVLQCPEN